MTDSEINLALDLIMELGEALQLIQYSAGSGPIPHPSYVEKARTFIEKARRG